MPRRALFALLLALAGAATALAEPPTAGVAAAEPAIPFKRSEDGAAAVAFRVIGGFVVVVLLGVGAVYALKHYLPTRYRATPGEAGHIKVIEAQRLTPRVTLFLIEVDGARLLISQAGERVTRLHGDAATPGGRGAAGEHRTHS